MKIVIIGAGVSGLIASISLKKKHPLDDVLVIDQNNKISKKTYATGNGRCNLGNLFFHKDVYNIELANKIVNKDSVKQMISFYESIGLYIRNENNYLYPNSLSSESYVNTLVNKAKQLGVKFLLGEKLKDYSENIIITTNKTINYDQLVIATGGSSSKKFGSDGSVLEILKNHEYKINEPLPGLCPIFTKEDTKEISGQRLKAKVTIIDDENPYSEVGEVLFKDDGLSGIVIFNIASVIQRRRTNKEYELELDLFNEDDEYLLMKKFERLNESNNNFFINLFNKKISEYILKTQKIKSKNKYSDYEIELLANACKHLKFTFIKTYDFDNSQVTVGGVRINNVNTRFESKLEKNVYLIGEVLDVDGLCGGYNFMWAALSALKLE